MVILHIWRKFAVQLDFGLIPTGACHDAVSVNSWVKPPVDWVKLNVDGATSLRTSVASCGGVLRDWNGQWIAGFSKGIGRCNAYMAEEWAIF